MGFREAVRLALQVIWAQKMKSSFSVIGVFIGVTFLIAVVSIVEGMNSYMTDRFASTHAPFRAVPGLDRTGRTRRLEPADLIDGTIAVHLAANEQQRRIDGARPDGCRAEPLVATAAGLPEQLTLDFDMRGGGSVVKLPQSCQRLFVGRAALDGERTLARSRRTLG